MVVVDAVRASDGAGCDLLAAARAGHLGAFETLHERHRDGILAQCRRALGSGAEADDATQETFLRAWRGLAGVRDDDRFAAWLRTIASNVCVDMLRQRRPTVSDDELGDPAVPDEADDRVEARAVASMLSEALARLSHRHRNVLWLRECEGWTYERIADDQRLEVSAVKSLLWRARQALRREFLELTSPEVRLSVAGLVVALRQLPSLVARSVSGVARVAAVPWEAGPSAAVAAAVAVTSAVVMPGMVLAGSAGTAASAAPRPPVEVVWVPIATAPVRDLPTPPPPESAVPPPEAPAAEPRPTEEVEPPAPPEVATQPHVVDAPPPPPEPEGTEADEAEREPPGPGRAQRPTKVTDPGPTAGSPPRSKRGEPQEAAAEDIGRGLPAHRRGSGGPPDGRLPGRP